jgi:hypothetical protein
MNRITNQINRKPASNIHHATRYAQIIGFPLNRHSTITFSDVGIAPEQASKALQKIIAERFSPWLRRHRKTKGRVNPTYVWVIEAVNGTLAAHLAVHIPKGLVREFSRKLNDWVMEQATDEDVGAAVKVTPIYNITGLKRYLLKGADAQWAKMCKITPIYQGAVLGKRAGHSRSLGPIARKANGYRPRKFFVAAAKAT